MKPVPLALALTAALVLAGCTAQGGEDPWAYAKKPLYADGFDLAKVAASGGSETREFRVTDGSIGAIRMMVWLNDTVGSGTVTITDPSGRTVLTTSETTERQVPLALGAWTAKVDAAEGSSGRVHIVVVRG